NAEERNRQKATDLITARTLGLGYLEEFKLGEAEAEFLKFIHLAPKEKLGYANLGLTYLRMGNYPEAKKQLFRAIKIDPHDPDIRLILATVYKMNDERDLAISELREALTFAPGHIKNLYEITELYSAVSGEDASDQRKKYLTELVENAPANLVPRLNLTEIFIRNAEFDRALEQMEIINSQFPEFPKEAVEYYDKTLSLLRAGDKQNALIQFTIFHNYLKVTSPYQAGIMDLKGPGGSLIGFPVITFDQQTSPSVVKNVSLLDILKFTDATSSAGLDIIPVTAEDGTGANRYSSHVEVADYDGDSDADIYAGSYDPVSASYKHYLFNNEMGKFRDVASEAGISHSGRESSAIFADYDNDGFLDLFVMKEGGDILYRNTGKGTFEDVTGKAGALSRDGGIMSLFFDMDHDGDLDLLEILPASNLFLRNNGDGTFADNTAKLGAQAGGSLCHDAAFGDFDDDEDIDFIITNSDSGIDLYSNQRQGVFRKMTVSNGPADKNGASLLAVGDYNNDGYLDLFTSSSDGVDPTLYRNTLNNTFEKEKSSNEMFLPLGNLKASDAAFIDFNNDGFLDLLITGESAENDDRAVYLFYNDGKGKFTDVSGLLPTGVKPGKQIAIFDYNNDGDLDALVAGVNGGVTLLRNDGGNNNHFITMKLVGLRAGSAKNNHFGIGVKVEIRAGDLYQTMVVTDPDIHFGIGSSKRADIIRIRWTNGVPQNIFLPGSDQALIEEQTLKGSCPFLYTWNGDEYVFVKDILWRSGLGMPTGIMGGATAYAFADASDDYLKIPGEMLKAENGRYSLQVISELWETIYLDKIQLVAADHPGSVDLFVPEQFSPPPFPGFRVIQVRNRQIPLSATDSEGNNVLPLIAEKDDIYLSDFKHGKYQGITAMHDLIIDPGELDTSGALFLFLNGWIFPTDASINVAISQSEQIRVSPPVIQVINKKGEWETAVENPGFPMGKDKTVIADLSGKITSDDHRIRIRTNLEIYWDQVFLSSGESDSSVEYTVMDPVSADLHYRGFSRLYRKGGRYGPHWFDYSVVEKGQKWRDLTGNYTRYGDVKPLLTEPDNKYVISNAGDEVTVEFNARMLPVLPDGWKRDFFIRSVGWVKDGDLNTAFGNTVFPLPFHGMKSYPPSETDTYPDDPGLQKYNMEYNTRVVTAEEYKNAVKRNSDIAIK
ncbi:MAG: VCBS repeat-containing protein, partial [Bacteroidales bacterium]|nr:VCBS repeat-containing protein [Bacteroidales bacterium]